MITNLLIIYAVALVGWIAYTLLSGVWHRLAPRHIDRLEGSFSQRYMRIVTAILLSDEPLQSHFPQIEARGAKDILARVLAKVSTSLYGPDALTVGRIAADKHIDRWLLRKIRHSRGFRRAYYISLLASLPPSRRIVTKCDRYADDPNPLVRFYALLIRIGSDPSYALLELSRYDHALTDFEVSQILAQLRRGLLPVACEPLLLSTNRNLRIIGIHIAREFGIEEATPLLLDIAASDSDNDIAQEALYAMIAMRTSFAHKNIVTRVRNLVESQRHSLCRRLAMEGYSANALEKLFGKRERGFATGIAATYKRRIVCSSQI